MPDSANIPRWLRAAWGALLILLNVFLLVYVVGFVALFGSFLLAPGFAGRYLNNEQWFFGMFSIVALAIFLSFGFMGLSILHVFRWSDLPSDRRLVWAVAMFAGAQPAALIYWYLHVWRREERQPRVLRHMPTDTPARRVRLLILGVVSIVPLLYMFGFVAIVMAGIAGAFTGGNRGTAPPVIAVLPAAHVSIIVLCWVLAAIYLIDVFRTPRLTGESRAVWAAVIAFGGFIGWPVYWYVNMWRPAPSGVPLSDVQKEREQAPQPDSAHGDVDSARKC